MMRKTRTEIVMNPMSTDGTNLHVDGSIDIDFFENDFFQLLTYPK